MLTGVNREVLRRCYDVDDAARMLGIPRRNLQAKFARRAGGTRRVYDTVPAFWVLDGVTVVDADSTDSLCGITPDPRRGVWRVLGPPVGEHAGVPTADVAPLLNGQGSVRELGRERDAREFAQMEATVEREARIRSEAELAVLKAAGEREEALALAASHAQRARLLEAALTRLEAAHAELLAFQSDMRSVL